MTKQEDSLVRTEASVSRPPELKTKSKPPENPLVVNSYSVYAR